MATKEQESSVWNHIDHKANYQFWRFLTPYPNAQEFLKAAQSAFRDVVFITSRSGKECQRATEDALIALGVKDPKVVIAKYKVPELLKYGVTDFLDDRDKNHEDVILYNQGDQQDKINANLWLLDRPWNREFHRPEVKRISNVMEVL